MPHFYQLATLSKIFEFQSYHHDQELNKNIQFSKFALMDCNKFYQKHFQDNNYLQALADAKLVTEDGWKFDVHQVILAQKSIFFRDLSCIYPNNPQDLSFPIKGKILNEILHFIYTESVEFNEDNFSDIIIASDYLQIDELHLQAKEFAKSVLSTENCFKLYVASVKVDCEYLQELCFRIIQTNFETMVQRHVTDFVEIPPKSLRKILKDNSLRVSGEMIVWESILKWINKDPTVRFKELFNFLKCLKFGDIEESLASKIIMEVRNNPYCEELQNIALQNFHSNLDALKSIVENSSKSLEIITPLSDFCSCRLPNYLHVFHIDDDALWMNEDDNGIFVTYDERVDIWRKVSDVDMDDDDLSFVHLVGSGIYVFARDIRVFDLNVKEWRVAENSFDVFPWANSVILRRNIYFISDIPIDNSLGVKCYNTENSVWSEAAFMSSVSGFKSVSFENKIFVLGQVRNDLTMLIQVYDEDANSWSIVPPPSIYRHTFSFVEYRGKLYVIGGVDDHFVCIRTVEVYDTLRKEWSRIDDLPFSFENDSIYNPAPLACVFNDRLIVIDNLCNRDEQYVLNETNKTWDKEKNQLRLEYECLDKMHTICDSQLIKAFVRESRLPETNLKGNPFQLKEIDSDDEISDTS